MVSELKVGDDIVIVGKTTGLEKAKVERLEIKNKSVQRGRKSQEIGLKLSKVRKNDEVYKIIK